MTKYKETIKGFEEVLLPGWNHSADYYKANRIADHLKDSEFDEVFLKKSGKIEDEARKITWHTEKAFHSSQECIIRWIVRIKN